MISAAPILTQLFLSCAALAGLFVLHQVLVRRDEWDPINRRFLFGVRVTMLLFLGRVLLVVTGIDAFRILILGAAAVIPLAVLLLTEGLLRRHAPVAIKLMVGGGAIIFSISALWYSPGIDTIRIPVLLAFQITGFLVAGWLIMRRDKSSLTQSENAMVVRLGLSLILLIPLAFGDFLLADLGLPVQLSALGVLILCWLAIGLGRPHHGHRATLVSFAMVVVAALSVGAMISFFVQGGPDGYILIIAIVMTTLFVVTIFNEASALRLEEQSHGLLRYLTEAQTEDAMVFLRQLQNHPSVEGAVLVSASSIADLQSDTIDQIFNAAPVLRKADPPQLGTAADEHIAYLFERYAATHIIMAVDSPRVLVALSMPSLGASPSAELELQIVQRMAWLIAQKSQVSDER